MKLDEWVKWGLDNNYLVLINNKYKLTNNLNRDANNIIPSDSNNSLALISKGSGLSRPQPISIEEIYKQFQLDAQVPFRVKTKDGSEFTVKTKSKGALVKLKGILDSGRSYQGLVLATRFYYAHPTLFKKPLAKYFEEDIWESYYDEVMSKAEEGILEKHVKDVMLPSSKFNRDL